MPVPCCAVDQDLAAFQGAGDFERDQGGGQSGDAQEQMDGVGVGDEVEEVAAGV